MQLYIKGYKETCFADKYGLKKKSKTHEEFLNITYIDKSNLIVGQLKSLTSAFFSSIYSKAV